MTEDEREATAHHEAGHAVVMIKLGIPLESVTIDLEGAVRGFTKIATTYELESGNDVKNCILAAYAGEHGQKLVDCNPDIAHLKPDLDEIERLCQDLISFGVPDARSRLPGFSKESAGLVSQYTSLIKAVARRLLELGKMNQKEVKQTIQEEEARVT